LSSPYSIAKPRNLFTDTISTHVQLDGEKEKKQNKKNMGIPAGQRRGDGAFTTGQKYPGGHAALAARAHVHKVKMSKIVSCNGSMGCMADG
jgi:hypothetical protein